MMTALVIDDTAVTRDGLTAGLGNEGFRVRAVASIEDATPFAAESPDVVVCDLYLDGPRSLPSLDQIATAVAWGVPVIVYSTWALDSDILAALAAGACGYVQKGTSFDPLVEAMRAAVGNGHEVILTPEVAGAMRRRDEFGLTPAETEVLRYLSLHLTNPEIAEARFTSLDTVKSQVSSIRQKLGAATRGDAVRRAHRLGLIGTWYIDG